MRNCINLRSPLITESFWRRRAIRRGPANFSIWERKRSSCPKKRRWWKKRGDLWRNAEIGPYYTRDRPADRFLRKDLVSVLFSRRRFIPMKPGTLTHTIAVILSSMSSLFSPSAPAAVPAAKGKLSKKSSKPLDDALLKVDPISYSPAAKADPPLLKPAERYAW